MAENIFVNIFYPEALDYADLTGIKHDMFDAQHYAAKLRNMYSEIQATGYRSDTSILIDALSTTALIKYYRPFARGVRKRVLEIIPDLLDGLTAEQKASHEIFCLWRNKHIAHSVDECEQNQPHARYWDNRLRDEGFTAIGCNHTRLAGLDMDDAESLVQLAHYFHTRVTSKCIQLEAELLSFVNALPIDKVLADGTVNVQLPMRIGMPRERI